MINIKKAVSDNKRATFAYTEDSAVWYETEHGELFPVPFDETKGARFLPTMKAIHLMRWMRKWNENNY